VLPNASVQGFLASDPTTPLFTTTADATGAFSQDQATEGLPRDAFLKASANGYLDSYYYPAVPLVHDLTVKMELFKAANLATFEQIAGVTYDSTTSTLLVIVTDCNEDPVMGATVTTAPGGTVVYFGDGKPSPGTTTTDSTGIALIPNLTSGNTTINATVSNMTLRSHDFDTVAGSLSVTEIQP
jgi:hypothetical protein